MDIPSWLLTTVSPLGALVGVLVFIGHAIIKGHLVPEKTHRFIIERHDREVATLNKALDDSQKQVDQLLETSETMNSVLTSLNHAKEQMEVDKP